MGIDDESSHPELCSEVAGSVTRTIVCLFREPDAGNPPVRFDEREEETELCQTGLRRRGESPANRHREANVTAPLLDSTRHFTQNGTLRLKACNRLVSPIHYDNPLAFRTFRAQCYLPQLYSLTSIRQGEPCDDPKNFSF